VRLDGVPDDFVLFSWVRRSPLTAAVLFVAARLESALQPFIGVVTDGDDATANPWYNFQYKVAGLPINWRRYSTSVLYLISPSSFFLNHSTLDIVIKIRNIGLCHHYFRPSQKIGKSLSLENFWTMRI
jgi:hypothetical protein